MKKFIGGFAIFASLLILASCGGASEDQIVGTWKVDAGAVDIQLGDGFPEEMKAMVENGEKQMKEDNGQLDKVSIEFKEDGKFVVKAEGEDENAEGTWKIDGDHLVIEAEVEGKKGSMKFNLDEVTDSKMKLSLNAEDVLAELKKQMPEALEQVPAAMDVDAMAKGTKLTFGLKK